MNTAKRQVEPIRDLVNNPDPWTDIIIYVAGSAKGKTQSAPNAHGFGVVITLDRRRARSGGHASNAPTTTFQRGYLGAAITALEWVRDNAPAHNVTIKTNATYVWQSASEWLPGWIAAGRLDDGHKKQVLNADLWRVLWGLITEMKLPANAWGDLEGKSDERIYSAALAIGRHHVLALRDTPHNPKPMPATPGTFAEFEFDEEVNIDDLIDRAIDRDNRHEARNSERQLSTPPSGPS